VISSMSCGSIGKQADAFAGRCERGHGHNHSLRTGTKVYNFPEQ
jgi:hypothetical protein